MGIAERKIREKERRRNEIIIAAEEVIFSKGYENATMEEIAERAELSKGTLYLYFKSKEELYAAISIKAQQILIKKFLEAIGDKKTGIEQIRAVGWAFFDFMEHNFDYFKSMMHFQPVISDLKNHTFAESEKNQFSNVPLRKVAEVIENGRNDGSIRKELDPYKTSILLMAQSYGVFMTISELREKLLESEFYKPHELFENYINLMYYALSPDEFRNQ